MGNYFNTVLNLIIFTFIAIVALTFGEKYEGRFFPVITNFEITKYEKHDNKTWVWVSFNKNRSCEYVGVAWYYRFSKTGLITFERKVLDLNPLHEDDYTRPDPNRPTGLQVDGPWEIDLPIDDVKNRSFLTTTHRCHPFYITRTTLYDSSK